MDKVKPKYNMVENTWYAIKHAAKYKPVVLLLIITQAVGSLMISLAQLYLPKTVVACIENGDSIQRLIMSVVILTAIVMIGYSMDNISGFVMNQNTYDLRLILQKNTAHKIHTTSYENIDDPAFMKAADSARLGLNTNNKGTDRIYYLLYSFLNNTGGFLIYMILLTAVNPLILLITATAVTVQYVIEQKYNKWIFKTRGGAAEYSSKIDNIANYSTDLKLAKDIRLFGMKNWIDEVRTKYYKLLLGIHKKQNKTGILVDLAEFLTAVCKEGIAYAFLIYLALTGQIIASDFILMFAAISGFAGYISAIFGILEETHRKCFDIDAVRVLLEYPDKFNMESGNGVKCDLKEKYTFEFRNVSYKYPEAEEYTIKNINLKINAGEKVAIVGLNGAGKTTLIKLMSGLYDPTEGEVLLNGKNIKEFNRRQYYEIFSAVFQDFSILPLSIKQNIAQSFDDIDDNRVVECIKLANLDKKIASLPDGLDSMLDRTVNENGVDLSGGEMQRLMLARALYKNAPVIILDEPTAALDPIAENEIYQRYNDLTQGRTSVFISHRLASTRFCDRILYVENGEIAEIGTHEELMNLHGKYYELFEVQSKYYKEGSAENE